MGRYNTFKSTLKAKYDLGLTLAYKFPHPKLPLTSKMSLILQTTICVVSKTT
ncbi:MAG: hypothetical protein KGD65_07865 [Candidatus Lokiarchaeota archaeon]|nr:hypothetical protein [Candidatus Lokiarchaeota archaeon]